MFLGWFDLLGIDWRSSFPCEICCSMGCSMLFSSKRPMLDSYIQKKVLKLHEFHQFLEHDLNFSHFLLSFSRSSLFFQLLCCFDPCWKILTGDLHQLVYLFFTFQKQLQQIKNIQNVRKKDCFIVNIEFKKWHAIRTSMDDVVACLCG